MAQEDIAVLVKQVIFLKLCPSSSKFLVCNLNIPTFISLNDSDASFVMQFQDIVKAGGQNLQVESVKDEVVE